jgi:demethylmenaquinone methyltransferase/2-methoxy-6-polyprenyl-1,4-benzoquinol methylase
MNKNDLAKYYADRASEYDAIYAKPERQGDIKLLSDLLTEQLSNKRVLEVACGTGYWTQFYGLFSNFTTATDYNEAVLSIARARLDAHDNIRVRQSDAYSLENISGDFNAGLAAFWWSHLEKTKIAAFLETFHSKLSSGSHVVMADNVYVEGSSTPLSHTDSAGNSYQLRRLKDGRTYEVLKNFPTEAEFRNQVAPYGENIQFRKFTYFWCGWYRLV